MAAKFHMNYEAPFVSAMGDFAEYLVGTIAKAFSTAKAALGSPLAALQTWQARLDQRRHLRELDGYLLADMGFTLEQADREATKPFWRA